MMLPVGLHLVGHQLLGIGGINRQPKGRDHRIVANLAVGAANQLAVQEKLDTNMSRGASSTSPNASRREIIKDCFLTGGEPTVTMELSVSGMVEGDAFTNRPGPAARDHPESTNRRHVGQRRPKMDQRIIEQFSRDRDVRSEVHRLRLEGWQF